MGILKSGFLHLTSLDSLKMNDLQEKNKGSQQERKSLFEMSFAHNNENMAMWGLYGIPFSESLCIILPKKAINKMVNNNLTISYGL